jgi:hypothetical protein
MASTMFGWFGHVDRKFTRFPVMTVHFFAIFSNPRAASCRAGGGLQFIKWNWCRGFTIFTFVHLRKCKLPGNVVLHSTWINFESVCFCMVSGSRWVRNVHVCLLSPRDGFSWVSINRLNQWLWCMSNAQTFFPAQDFQMRKCPADRISSRLALAPQVRPPTDTCSKVQWRHHYMNMNCSCVKTFWKNHKLVTHGL